MEPYLGILLPLMAKKEDKGALKWGQVALKIDPSNCTALSTAAYAHYLNGDSKIAAVYYLRLTKLYPADVTMRIGLAWAYLKADERFKAQKEFIRVLNLNPTNQLAISGYNLSK